MADGEIDFRSYTRAQLEDARSRIDRERYPQNYKNLSAELLSGPKQAMSVAPLPPAPRNVSYAVRLLWATLAVGALRLVVVFPHLPKTLSFGTEVGVLVPVLSALPLIYWWVLGALSRGRNEARIALLVLFLLWLFVAYGQFATAYSRSMLEGNILVFQQILYLAALLLLFSRPSRDWYQAHAQRTAAAA